jgi:hypothetical protein
MRIWTGAVALALALALLGAQGAIAAETVGNPCVADAVEPPSTMIGLSNQGSEPFMQPEVPPEHHWVITRWRVPVNGGIGPIPQQLIASHQVGEEDDVLVGESAIENLVPGINEFATRVPVSELAHIGLRGPEGTLICHQELNDAGRVKGSWATGEQRHFEILTHIGVPLVVTVERDDDGDGYGDQTQDACPASAALQTPCPPVILNAHAKPKRGVVLIHVTASAAAALHFEGNVKWRLPGAAVLDYRGELDRQLAAAQPLLIRFPLKRVVQRRLGTMSRKQFLRARLNLSATDALGRITEKRLTVKLRGRRPARP